jgi:competence protein ComEC
VHHGGDTNAEGFLEAVGTAHAIISVEEDNDYGHPHPDVLDDLAGAQIHRTDEHGDVRIVLKS